MIVNTFPLPHTHRDKLNRVIRRGDYAVWSNRKYGTGLGLVSIETSTPLKVRIKLIDDDSVKSVDPANLIVITKQVEANIDGNVGANIDLEELRNAQAN